ncbi:hypothetical protein F5051DRAFT_390699 [Lentinula edodes]|nr:hypothetical protein F5051DRAFT_390699 [Lentinula edodes]
MNLLHFARICLSLYMLRRGSNGTARLPSSIMLDVGPLATQLTTGIIVFLIDVIVVAIVRNGKKHCHAELR